MCKTFDAYRFKPFKVPIERGSSSPLGREECRLGHLLRLERRFWRLCSRRRGRCPIRSVRHCRTYLHP